jgi:hypothetical protein
MNIFNDSNKYSLEMATFWGEVKINVVLILESRGVVCVSLGVEGRDGT